MKKTLLTLMAAFLAFSFLQSQNILTKKSVSGQSRPRINLSGLWAFRLDSLDKGITEKWQEDSLNDSLYLPGTTDTNKKGVLNTRMDETTFLSREYSYVGKAWYSKTVLIPDTWAGKEIRLCMERTKPTLLWIDGIPAGTNNNISTPQIYDLSGQLSPGQHTFTILVDNGKSVPPQLLSNSHAYTESTQTNWNGIIGDFFLEASDLCHIEEIQISPDFQHKSATISVKVENKNKVANIQLSCYAEAWNTDQNHKTDILNIPLDPGKNEYTLNLELGEKALLWSEFSPALYRVVVTLDGDRIQDTQEVNFGMREFKTKGTQFTINKQTTFLRGKHDACVFPLTAHVAMDRATWQHYFQVAKSYGINHYRFHSWCPPRACFEAADIEGIYLQPELPFWGSFKKEDNPLISFLQKEGLAIQKEYGNHASFVMFALGNELSGDQEVMMSLVNSFRKADSRHLYALGSNNYLGFRGQVPGEDYLTTCRVGQESDSSFITHARSSFSFADAYDGGYMNHTYPSTQTNFSTAVSRSTVPVISHETGQYQIYPNYDEMKKYTGVLKPRNFEVFKQRLKEAGMEPSAKDFFKASGTWSALLYRAEIEMDLRTPGFGGFQLLDLQDYPGQGSAYVGILDAFMDSKGLITPEAWREFCCEVVPLFVTDRFCRTSEETLQGEIQVANYSSEALTNKKLNWTLRNASQKIIKNGSFDVNSGQGTLSAIGKINSDLSSVTIAEKLSLTLSIEGTRYQNSYPFWVYPVKKSKSVSKKILVTKEMDDKTMKKLKRGANVLWFPNKEQFKAVTVGGLFQTDYWNYRMFKSICDWAKKPASPGTMGLFMNPQHPVFNDFPTEFHTNWQWFPIVKQSYPMILDRLPAGYTPIVQVIDNIERNHKLGLVFEFKIEKGKLLVCMSNLEAVLDKPEARQFYSSLLNYMESKEFNPSFHLSADGLNDLFNSTVKSGKIKTLGNISYD